MYYLYREKISCVGLFYSLCSIQSDTSHAECITRLK